MSSFFPCVTVSLPHKAVICSPSLQTLSLSGLFSTLRSCPWISGSGTALKDMVRWCCQHLQVKPSWSIMFIVWGNEPSGSAGSGFSSPWGGFAFAYQRG